MAEFDIEAYLEEQVAKPERSSKDKMGEDQERERDRDRDGERSRDRERRRDRDASKDRSRRHRSRSRSDDRKRDRDRRSRRDSRSRSRSPDRRRDRDRDRDRRGRSRSPPAREPAAIAPPRALTEEEKLQAKKQKEIDDLTKDQRTIFVSQLTMKVEEKHLREYFGQLGAVKTITMLRDKQTGKHKGFAYVEMADLEVIADCLLFNETVPDFQKFPILVKASQAEKNYLAKKDVTKVPGPKDGPDRRVYVGNIHVAATENELRPLLERFGPVESISIHRDDMGNSKGFAFVAYVAPESAAMAMTGLVGVDFAGRPLKVGPVIDNQTKAIIAAQQLAGGSSGIIVPSGPGMSLVNQAASANWRLDDDDGNKGHGLNSQSRQMLMARLGENAGIQVPVAPVAPVAAPVQQIAPPPITGAPSNCFLITNMFDPATETDPNWDQDIREDVTEECSKFGRVEHCYVEARKPGGLVFVRFTALQASVSAAQSMNGRFFAGRMITVTYLDPAIYASLVA